MDNRRLSAPFAKLRAQTQKPKPRRKPELFTTRLPATTIEWIKSTARKHGLTQEQIVLSLLLSGIASFEKERPLG